MRRPLGDLGGLLGVDPTQVLHLLAVHAWTALAGDSIEAVRAFSAVGTGVAAAATVVLVARYRPTSTAVAAGVTTALLPGLSWAAVDGRSHAWAAALAVLATVALDDARYQDTRLSWVRYGAVVVVGCWWHPAVALLVAAHAVAVVTREGWAVRTWGLTTGCVGLATAPLALLAWLADETGSPHTGEGRWIDTLVRELTGPDLTNPLRAREVAVVAVVGLAAHGVVRLWQDGESWLAVLLASWAAVPSLAGVVAAATGADLLLADDLALAVPAFAAAAGVGACSLPRWAPPAVGALGLLVVVPLVWAQRADDAKPDDLRAVAETAARSNASVWFADPAARAVAVAYPAAFSDNADLSAVRDPAPDPFFDEVRDPTTLAPHDVAGHRVLVYGRGRTSGPDRLAELGCTGRTILREGPYRVRYYRCPALSPALR